LQELPSFSLDLEEIALRLEALEETIIYHLIERVQYRLNARVYERGQSGFEGFPELSLLDIRLLFHEQMDAQFGRFMVPEERPFSGNLPQPKRKVNLPRYPLKLADFNAVNLTAEIKKGYLSFLPDICEKGDDGQYGSTIEHDVFALQAISRRIHYGAFFVAESKFQANPPSYTSLIKAKDHLGLLKLLTRPEVEKSIVERVGQKAALAQAKANRKIRYVLAPEAITRFYEQTIIPLTKEGEVLYLLKRPCED